MPAWLLGIRALERSVVGRDFQPAELACALEHFAYAARLVTASADPQLAGNIYNSWGVALVVESIYSGKRELLKNAAAQFSRAASLGGKDVFGKGAQAAKYNLGVLKGKKKSRRPMGVQRSKGAKSGAKKHLKKKDGKNK